MAAKKKREKINRHQRKALALAFLAVLILGWGLSTQVYPGLKKLWASLKKDEGVPPTLTLTPTPTPQSLAPTPFAAKDKASIDMPYTVQAPNARWGVHQESCEEAASLMYHYFLQGQSTFGGKTVIPPDKADRELIAMKDWQVKRDGREKDLSIKEWGQFMQQYYGYSYQVYENITQEDIRREISQGRPVVVPVITHALENPHYGAHPSYHVLLIKGYKEGGVIANDAGVKEGENYFYSWEVLFKAIDAQTPKMGQGRTMVVVAK